MLLQNPPPMLITSPFVFVPGWRNCGGGHWQSLWAAPLAGAIRLQLDDWAMPTRTAWVRALSRAIQAQPHPVVVVAHSLGCIATVHLPAEVAAHIQGALFVAPVDPERRAVLCDFAPVPCERLPYRHVVVAGSNDPFCPPRLAAAYARSWGSEFMRIPDMGDIAVQSGRGEWPLGLALLQSLSGSMTAAPLQSMASR